MLPRAFRVGDVEIAPNVLLAPMEGVTDVTFRRLVRQIGGCGLTTTEFIPGEGLRRGDRRALRMAEFDADERPVAVQVFGRDPAVLAEAARVAQDLGATILDINMGCPSKKVCARSGGSALMKEPALATAIVRAVVAAVDLPVTVKMRSGFDADRRNAPELAWQCQEEGAQAVTIHWRTREDRYGGERRVDCIAAAKARLRVPVIANGDVVDVPSALRMFRETGCDGVMIGRGAMRSPWVLRHVTEALAGEPLTPVDAAERQRVLLGYLDAQLAYLGHDLPVLGKLKQVAKHFFHAGLPGAADARMAVLRSQTVDEARDRATAWFARLAAWEGGELDAFADAPAAR